MYIIQILGNLDNKISLKIKGKDLKNLTLYLTIHQMIPVSVIQRPLVSDDLKLCIPNNYDYAFISELSLEDTADLLSVAKDLEIKSLADLCYTKIALFIRS